MFERGDVVRYYCPGHSWHDKIFVMERNAGSPYSLVSGRIYEEEIIRRVTVTTSCLRKIELE